MFCRYPECKTRSASPLRWAPWHLSPRPPESLRQRLPRGRLGLWSLLLAGCPGLPQVGRKAMDKRDHFTQYSWTLRLQSQLSKCILLSREALISQTLKNRTSPGQPAFTEPPLYPVNEQPPLPAIPKRLTADTLGLTSEQPGLLASWGSSCHCLHGCFHDLRSGDRSARGLREFGKRQKL